MFPESESIHYPSHPECLTETKNASAAKIFGNSYIVEQILDHVDEKTCLGLRRVNSAFNETCHRVIRKKNRTMKIEILRGYKGYDTVVHVNRKPRKLSKLTTYFSFLTKVAELKVERIVVIDAGHFENEEIARRLHDVVLSLVLSNQRNLKEITGLYDACDFCHICQHLSVLCQTIGPMPCLMACAWKKHFKKIIVKDVALEDMANACLMEADSKESFMNYLEDQMDMTNITCSTLVLQINENRRSYRSPESMPIPGEVLQILLKKWEVKNVELNFVCEKFTPAKGRWTESPYFTGFKFNTLIGSARMFDAFPKCDHIHVDLSRSVYCANDLKLTEASGYENLIANIRKIFNPCRISIDFPHWELLGHENLSQFLENFLRISRIYSHQKLRIDVKFYTKLHDDVKIENGKVDLEIPEPFEIVGPKTSSYHKSLKGNGSFETEKWVGERCRFRDFDRNLTLNVDIFVLEEEINKVVLDHFQSPMLEEFRDMFQFEEFDD